MYTFKSTPRGILVISENGYEIPWGKNGTIPDEASRLCDLNCELDEDFAEWICDMTNEERVAAKNDFFNKEKKSVHALRRPVLRGQQLYFSTLSATTTYTVEIKKEEETMNTIRFEDTQEGKAQVHVLRRANDAFLEKESELLKHYGLRNDEAPRSWNELVKRIKDGKFKIDDDHAMLKTYGSGTEYVEWRDPKIEKDHEGFEKSMDKLRKLLAETKDVIIVKSPADGLEMIEKIQNFKH